MKKTKTPNDYVTNCLKPPKAFFEWCYENMPTYKWSNKKETIIGSKRNHYYTHEKRLTKKSRLSFYDRKDYFQIVLSTRKRIEIQTYVVWSFFEQGKQRFEVKLLNLEHISGDRHIKVGLTYNEHYKFGLVPNGNMLSCWYARPVIYPNEWLKRLCTVSELRYLKIDQLFVDDIAHIYKYRLRIEYAQRINAPALAKQIMNARLDMRTVTMKWLRRNKVFFRNTNRTFQAFQLKQALESIGTKYIAGIEEYLSENEVKKIPKEIKPITFQNYLIKQGKSFQFYHDYISILQELKYPITPLRRFPKDLEKVHDDAVNILNATKKEIVRKEFEKRAKEWHFLEITLGDVQFVLPKEANELIEEGKQLKHCVGGSHYINDHADGKTTIVFIRKISDPEKPYYTLEYRDNKIIQIHGLKHIRPNDKLREAVNKWLEIANHLVREKEKKHVA